MKIVATLGIIALTACATQTGTVHEDAGKALIAAEAVLDAAVLAADAAVRSHLTTPAQNARIVALAPQVKADLDLARKAYAASDQPTMMAEIAALTALAAQLDAAH